LLTQWYSTTERGTAWSIWTASNNVGGFAAPWIAGTAAGTFGWRWGMWVPAICALSVASIILFTITDKPIDRGFAPVDAKAAVATEREEKEEKNGDGSTKGVPGPSVHDILFQDVLPNPSVWLFALSYFFVYLVRQGASTWFVHYLMNVKGVSVLSAAAAQVSGLEVGGFFGALSAGVHPVMALPCAHAMRPSCQAFRSYLL
jgi:MFS transporter, OPA family, sugar phosphate sensor protein UhpC